MVLAQGLSQGCSQAVSQGCSLLKTQLGLKDLLSSSHMIIELQVSVPGRMLARDSSFLPCGTLHRLSQCLHDMVTGLLKTEHERDGERQRGKEGARVHLKDGICSDTPLLLPYFIGHTDLL